MIANPIQNYCDWVKDKQFVGIVTQSFILGCEKPSPNDESCDDTPTAASAAITPTPMELIQIYWDKNNNT